MNHIKKTKLILSVACLALITCGCSMSTEGISSESMSSPNTSAYQDSQLNTEYVSSENVPIEFEVLSDTIKGRRLYINMSLTALRDINAKDIVARAVGLNEEKIVEENVQNISNFFAQQVIQAGESVDVRFVLNAENINAYQVFCDWSLAFSAAEKEVMVESLDDVKSSASDVFLKQPVLTQESVSCEAEPCDILFTVSTSLVNKSSVPVTGIELALGIFWKEAGAEVLFPASFSELQKEEEALSLGDFTLLPGSEKKIKIKIDRPVPIVKGGNYVPNLRLLQTSDLN